MSQPYADTLPRVDAERAKVLPPAPQDCDQTWVTLELWNALHDKATFFFFVVSHKGDAVHHVAFPADWRHLLRAIDLDPDDSHVQSWLHVEACRAFARSGR